jgi:hypothetical protein
VACIQPIRSIKSCLIVDSFQQVKEINPAGAALFGKRRHQIRHTPFPVYVDPRDREPVRLKVSRVCAGADEKDAP